jgi:hypothetical protein
VTAEFKDAVERKKRQADEASKKAHAEQILREDTPPDVTSPRAKSSRHKKSTADKWNQ